MTPDAPLTLEGVRILDFSRIWAGPHATKLLADMGAEVIKVESARAWDPHRMIDGSGNLPDGDPGPDRWNRSGWFNTLHLSKYGITVEIRRPRGKAILEELVSVSDVVIENYRAGAMERRGFGYERLRALRPDIVVVSMPALGNKGPWRDFIQYGIGQEQLGGIASMNGYLDRDGPVKSGVNFGDPVSGAHAAGAVLSALWRRRRTGRGAFIDLAQLESSVSVIGEHIIGQQMDGVPPENRGNRHPVFAPHGAYRCAGEDRWVTIAVTTDDQWRTLCEALGSPELADDPRYADILSRHENHDGLDAIISAWTQGRDPYDVMHALQERGVPATPVMTGQDIFNDPHYQDRGVLELVDHPSTGPYFIPGIAWKMSKTPGRVRWPSPRMGEHNERVFGDLLGMSAEAISGLADDGVTGTEPAG
ncbi:MAG: CoA transferase [SAR202 cluster bacterium]|nr:CoA transferase [SAR202 cluster bacterium]